MLKKINCMSKQHRKSMSLFLGVLWHHSCCFCFVLLTLGALQKQQS